ncbi:MAG: nuclear transport factor 2 family protein [Acidobacteriales bacterium]|nr:nuclear transport factor 2 family protein [Terriglobales bacterium]
MGARLILAAALMLTATGCTMWPEHKNPNWQQATGAERFEQLYWQEWKAKNWLELEARTASNFTRTTADGTFDKAQTMAEYRKSTLVEYTLGEFNVVAHGASAVVSYTAQFQMESEGMKSAPRSVRRMSVWQQEKSGWVLVASSESDMTSRP